ncbi:MAG: hypothetical protein E7258_08425 [Lachnospiraceae bacterium]|nr:hypothetical protein [Lachnospiraceae bacterium]
MSLEKEAAEGSVQITYGISEDTCPFFKIEERGNLTIYKMNFKSLSGLHLFLNENPVVNNNIFYTLRSEKGSEKFAGAPLFEAIGYLIGGYLKDFEMFVKLKKEIDKVNIKYENTRKVRPSVVGSRPNVPAFIAGAPKTMYRVDRAKEKRFVDIYINIAYDNNTTEAQIRNRGILVLNLVKLLESHDYGVNLKVFEACMVGGEAFCATVGLKQPGELLNEKKCYYPMCGKEFLRRIMARVKESMPFKENWHMSYGQVLNESQTRIIMDIPEDAIFINSPKDMDILGENIYEDADRFLDKINLTKEIEVPRYAESNKEE